MTPEEEMKLVTGCQSGSEEAFCDLVRFMAPPLIRFLYAFLNDIDAAEEVAQLSFLRAHRGMARLREPRRFRAWLWRIARYAALDRIRQENRRGPKHDSFNEIGESWADENLVLPEEELVRMDMIETTRKAIDQLPPEIAKVLRLRYEKELTYRELAEELGLTLFQVKARLARARNELRPKLLKAASGWEQFCDEQS